MPFGFIFASGAAVNIKNEFENLLQRYGVFVFLPNFFALFKKKVAVFFFSFLERNIFQGFSSNLQIFTETKHFFTFSDWGLPVDLSQHICSRRDPGRTHPTRPARRRVRKEKKIFFGKKRYVEIVPYQINMV